MSGLGARAELLATGALGKAGVELLYTSVRQAVRLRGLPPPAGAPVWTTDAVMEAAHDIVVARSGPARIAMLAARSSDETTFRSQLFTLVLNDLASTARRTARGRLSERIKDVLATMDDVHASDGRFILDGVAAGQAASFADLAEAAAHVAVIVPRWSDQARRQAPEADAASMQGLVRALLRRVSTGLSHSELVAVLAERLGVHDRPAPVEQHVLEMLAPPARAETARDAVAAVGAEQILAQLTVEQQMVLPYLEDSVRDIADVTGLRRNKAWQVAQATRLKLAELLDDDPDSAHVLGAAAQMARTRWGLR